MKAQSKHNPDRIGRCLRVNHKIFTQLLAAITITAGLTCPLEANAAAPAPVLHDDNPDGHFGDWYTGAVPSQASGDKPVILFVQGLHSTYKTWYAADGFYEAAYNAGYRTAFIQLQDADGPGGSMWTNGRKLASVIKKVADYYDVSKIMIIAHSKGGIDTQAALVHYGAYPYVDVVHQLSTPNKGSELADMAYTKWAGWLAEIIGQKDDAVYSLQTAYMDNFRSQTDSRSENKATTTYMSGGMGDDGWFSATWFAHAVLPGEDDGAVSLSSALGIPYGIKSFTKNISHSQMAKASQTWNLVLPKLEQAYAQAEERPIKTAASRSKSSGAEKSSVILRGGKVDGNASESFVLESGIKKLALDAMTSSKDTEVALISPSGKKHKPDRGKRAGLDEAHIFGKAIHHFFEVEDPEPGEWTIELEGADDAFFMVTSVEGGEEVTVKANKKVYKKGEKAKVSVDFGRSKIEPESIGKAKLTQARNGKKPGMADQVKLETMDGNLAGNFTVPQVPGVYNLSFDVTALTEKGEPFTRSINYNFAVTDEEGSID